MAAPPSSTPCTAFRSPTASSISSSISSSMSSAYSSVCSAAYCLHPEYIAGRIAASIARQVHEGLRNVVKDDAVMNPLADTLRRSTVEPFAGTVLRALYIQTACIVTTEAITLSTVYFFTRGRRGRVGGGSSGL